MSTSNIPPVSSGAAKPSGSGQVVQIVSLPEGLQNNVRAIRLEGEVIQQNKDGSVRLRTPEGDIDIQVRGRQPQPGQKMEVDIPPGSPPRNATVRPAPTQPQPAPQPPPTSQPLPDDPLPLPQTPVTKPAPQQPPPSSGTTQPTAPSVGAKPAPLPVAEKPAGDNPDIYQPATTSVKPLPSLPPLTAGHIVKLVPMAASAPMPDAPQTGIVSKVAAQAGMIAQKGEGNLITTLLQAVKSVIPQSILPQTSTGLPAAPTPATNAPQQILPLMARVLSLTLPSGQTFTMPQTQPAQTLLPSAPAVPGATIQTPAAPVSSSLLTITVTEVTPQNQPVIPVPMNDKGAVQNFILQSPPASVPVGTQITLQPQPLTVNIQTPAQNTTTTLPMQPGTLLPPVTSMPVTFPTPVAAMPPAWRAALPLMQPLPVWPTVDELFQTFYQATPQAAQIMGRTIPSPANAANFGPALMLFAAALKSGELQAWMGDRKLDMLQKLGKDSILSRLSGETSPLTGSTDTPATEWKSLPIPLLWQNEISKVMFHVRKEPHEKENAGGDTGTRFVMDLALTRMGDVQLDGLVRGKQLDLVVRTHSPISYSMQDAMRTAYAKALDGTDIYGDIGFQSDGKGWEDVLENTEIIKISI